MTVARDRPRASSQLVPTQIIDVDVVVIVVVDLDRDGDVEVIDTRSPEQPELSSGMTSTST
jgi:hypothetical protein